MRDHDLSGARHHQAHIEGSVLTTAVRPGDNAVRECVAQTTSDAASSSSQSALGRRLAPEDHCDPKPIRLGLVSSGDESDQLPRQDREAPRRAGDDAQLEHDRKSRENSTTKLTELTELHGQRGSHLGPQHLSLFLQLLAPNSLHFSLSACQLFSLREAMSI